VVVEEAWPLASISSELAYIVQRRAFDYLDAPVVRITCADVPLALCPYPHRSLAAKRGSRGEGGERSDLLSRVANRSLA
jgi:pyruvate/2-oxoglutarate/acetoin dehydrogenase E1 component